MMYTSVADARAKLLSGWRWPNFSVEEIACRCAGKFCRGEYWHDAKFLSSLEALRDKANLPLVISSGHRCAQWNAVVGGAPRSMHKTIAVDVLLRGHERHALRQQAESLGFTGIGLGKTFIHLDQRTKPATWFYNGSYSLWQT